MPIFPPVYSRATELLFNIWNPVTDRFICKPIDIAGDLSLLNNCYFEKFEFTMDSFTSDRERIYFVYANPNGNDFGRLKEITDRMGQRLNVGTVEFRTENIPFMPGIPLFLDFLTGYEDELAWLCREVVNAKTLSIRLPYYDLAEILRSLDLEK